MPSKTTEKVIQDFRKEKGFSASKKFTESEILERLLFPMVNEAAEILDQGKALRPSDIDVVWCNGYVGLPPLCWFFRFETDFSCLSQGFPRAKGGLMFFADHVGVDRVLNRLKELQKQYGDDFKPAALLEKMVREGKKFSDLPANDKINTDKVNTRVGARM